jgi:hypothetical protein
MLYLRPVPYIGIKPADDLLQINISQFAIHNGSMVSKNVELPLSALCATMSMYRQPDAAEITRLFNEMLPSSLDKTNANVSLEQPVRGRLLGFKSRSPTATRCVMPTGLTGMRWKVSVVDVLTSADRVTVLAQVPSPLNGKFSWFNSGLAYGMWLGLLAAYDMPFQV